MIKFLFTAEPLGHFMATNPDRSDDPGRYWKYMYINYWTLHQIRYYTLAALERTGSIVLIIPDFQQTSNQLHFWPKD